MVRSTTPGGHRPTKDAPREKDCPDRTEIYVLPRAVILARPDHTKIEAAWGTDTGEPLPADTRRALEAVAR